MYTNYKAILTLIHEKHGKNEKHKKHENHTQNSVGPTKINRQFFLFNQWNVVGNNRI